jgi:hypothetical protein
MDLFDIIIKDDIKSFQQIGLIEDNERSRSLYMYVRSAEMFKLLERIGVNSFLSIEYVNYLKEFLRLNPNFKTGEEEKYKELVKYVEERLKPVKSAQLRC